MAAFLFPTSVQILYGHDQRMAQVTRVITAMKDSPHRACTTTNTIYTVVGREWRRQQQTGRNTQTVS